MFDINQFINDSVDMVKFLAAESDGSTIIYIIAFAAAKK